MAAALRRLGRCSLASVGLILLAGGPHPAAAQQVDGDQPRVNAALNDFGLGAQGLGGGGNGFLGPNAMLGGGGAGGAASADFDSLIDLITSTVQADSWEENGTGEGEIQPFPNGVWLDAAGNLVVRNATERASALASLRQRGAAASVARADGAAAIAASEASAPPDARRNSPLRFVSLPRLEAAIAIRQSNHLAFDPAMLSLAGLQRIQFVLIYPESGDLALAGPAGDWRTAPGAGLVDADTGRPLVRLDDLLALWRRQRNEGASAFGCSITPRQDALAATQQYLAASAARPLEPGERRQWLGQLRDTLGVQDVEFFHIDPNTRVAGLLLAADYHMKLVGMGLAEGVPGVKNYLATVRLGPGGAPPPMSILRWWFAMPSVGVEATLEHDAFALPANSVQVLSENELLAARGQRVHTGQSDDLNSQFARSFTAEFAALADKYPVYGQLARVFELSLALALIDREDLAAKVNWTPTLLLDGDRLRLPQTEVPRGVETVINHRVIGGRTIIAGVSGGVWIDGTRNLAVTSAEGESATMLARMRKTAPAAPAPPANAQGEIVWWWD